MFKISAIIVDDEIKNNELLNIYIGKYCPIIDVVAVATTVEDAIIKINKGEIDRLLRFKP